MSKINRTTHYLHDARSSFTTDISWSSMKFKTWMNNRTSEKIMEWDYFSMRYPQLMSVSKWGLWWQIIAPMTFGVVGLVNLSCAVIGIYYSIDMYIYEYNIYIYIPFRNDYKSFFSRRGSGYIYCHKCWCLLESQYANIILWTAWISLTRHDSCVLDNTCHDNITRHNII